MLIQPPGCHRLFNLSVCKCDHVISLQCQVGPETDMNANDSESTPAVNINHFNIGLRNTYELTNMLYITQGIF